MAELKPCPFCGGKASCKPFKWIEFTSYHVCCEDCRASTIEFDYAKEAVEAWNRRADNAAD